MSKHTPGPWVVKELTPPDPVVGDCAAPRLVIDGPDGVSIVSMWYRTAPYKRSKNHGGKRGNFIEHPAEAVANAILIAAAPELLGALKALAPILDNDGPLIAAYAELRPIVHAAIAKAEGK